MVPVTVRMLVGREKVVEWIPLRGARAVEMDVVQSLQCIGTEKVAV